MLVLTRRLGQDLILTDDTGSEIRICLLSMSMGYARLGIYTLDSIRVLIDDDEKITDIGDTVVLVLELGQNLLLINKNEIEIKVYLSSISGGQARIGIDAPKTIHILRDNAIVREDTKKVTGV